MRFNLDGYICLRMSRIWGALGFAIMKWGNTLALSLLHLIPQMLGYSILILLSIRLTLDIVATLAIISGKSKDEARWIAVDHQFSKISFQLGKWISYRVDNRIKKAYPYMKKATIVSTEDALSMSSKNTTFAYGCSFHKIVWLFIIGAFLGDITETLYCRIAGGVWMSRSSVVWGPFSIVWDLAIAAATALLHRYRDKSIYCTASSGESLQLSG